MFANVINNAIKLAVASTKTADADNYLSPSGMVRYGRAVEIRDEVSRLLEAESLGEIRPDLDTLLAADSVCLRASSNLPQSGNL